MKIDKGLIILCSFMLFLLILAVSGVYAYSSSTLSNNLTTENLTFTGYESEGMIIRTLLIPSNTLLTNAYLNLTGYNYSFFDYQENGSSYLFTGSWYSNSGCSDGNWNNGVDACHSSGGLNDVVYTVNYTKPNNYQNSSKWLVSTSRTGLINISLNNSCFNYPQLSLRVELNDSTNDGITFKCYNGTWNFLLFYAGNYQYNWLDEEAMVWNITNAYPSNTQLIVGSSFLQLESNTFNYSNRTINLYNQIDNYLSTCSYFNGFCSVPIIFHSDTSGILNYNNLIFNNSGFIENNISYTSNVIEGQNTIITGNFTFGESPSSIVLVYNNTQYSPSINLVGYNYILTSNVYTPLVSSDQNISFYYYFIINGTQYNSTIKNQTVNNIQLTTSCAGNYKFLNISNYDEETLNQMNGTVDYILNLLSSDNEITTLNGTATGTNFTLCSNVNLTNTYTNFNLQLRYYSTGYAYKTYNIQNSESINIPLGINLFYLNSSIGTQFKISYADFNYLIYPNAIMQIQRQYINTNTFNTAEIPVLDSNGKTTGTFNTNNIKYKIIVINNGQILDTFENVFPSCQNIVLGTCELNLRGNNNDQSSTNGDFTYTLVKTNTSLILTYIIPSGTPRNINFKTNQNSRFLNNISVCDQTIFASGGTITCGYNETVGDSIIDTQIINSDGTTLYAGVQISEDLNGFFLLNNYFIAFVFLLSLGLMFVSSGFMLVVSAVIGLIYLTLIFLLRGVDLMTLTGSIGFLIVAAGIVIYKISQKEERA